jgi:putative peptide zinc metalloprotease protein
MTSRLLSSWWYRVENRKPKLRSHVRLHRHQYRGEVWHLLEDPASSRVHRFSASARLIIALMDGTRSVGQLWKIANERLGEDAPTQDEIIELLGQLHSADLLQSDVTPDAAELFARGEREERARHLRSYANPMAIRVSLWDPDAFLNRIGGVSWLWSKLGALVWCAVVLPAFFLVSPHWADLTNNFTDRILAVDNLFVLSLVFPVIKALHELGHATATKAGGGEVHDLGVIMLVLLPVPYVDASAASVFKSKYRRAVVGAAGMLVELFVAAIAFYLWLLIEPGVIRAILFNVMLIASVSTLLFNGNPLLRYDAYYILADLIEIPNLAARSAQYWRYLVERYVLGVSEAQSPEVSRAEKAWFLFYGLASTIYRFFVTVVIALFIAKKFFVIGVLLAIWAVAAMTLFPVIKAFRHLVDGPRFHKHRARAVVAVIAIVVGLGAILFAVPVPSHSYAEGVLWLPEEAVLRAGASGFLSDFAMQPGTRVTGGESLVRLYDPVLKSQVRRDEGRVAELQAEYTAQFVTDLAKAQIVHDQLDGEQANLARVRERAADLVVRAKTDGIFIAPQTEDMPGRFYRKGELLGYVIGKVRPIARVVVPQEAVDRVRRDSSRIRIRLVDHPVIALDGKVLREVPAGDDILPSAALAVDGGGEIGTDPRGTKGPKALQRVFQFDIELDGIGAFDHFGERVLVRFEHHAEPLAVQWYRGIRLLFLSAFNV